MIKQVLLVALALVCAVHAIHLHQIHEAGVNLPKAGVVSLQADNGFFLKLCNGCGPANAVSVEAGSGPNYKWNLSIVGTKVVLQASNGNWLSRCNNCWKKAALKPDSAFAQSSSNTAASSQWTALNQTNGKWVFKADNGKLLSRCNGCVQATVPNIAFVQSGYSADPWSQWTLSYA